MKVIVQLRGSEYHIQHSMIIFQALVFTKSVNQIEEIILKNMNGDNFLSYISIYVF